MDFPPRVGVDNATRAAVVIGRSHEASVGDRSHVASPHFMTHHLGVPGDCSNGQRGRALVMIVEAMALLLRQLNDYIAQIDGSAGAPAQAVWGNIAQLDRTEV